MSIEKTNKDVKDLIENIKNLYNRLGKKIPTHLDKPIEDIIKYYKSATEAYNDFELKQKGLHQEIISSTSGLSDLKDRFNDISKTLQSNVGDPYKRSLKSFEKLINYGEDLSDIQYDLSGNSLKDTRVLKEKINLEFQRLSIQGKYLDEQKKELETAISRSGISQEEQNKLKEQRDKVEELQQFNKDQTEALEKKVGYQDKFNEALDKTYKQQKNVHNAIGLTGKLIGGLGKTIEKLGFDDFSTEIDIARKKMGGMAIDITNNGEKAASFVNIMKIGFAGISSLGKSMLSSLSDPLVVLTLIVKTIKSLISLVSEFKKEEAEIGKAFGIAGKEAQKTHNIIRQSQDLYHFPKELLDGQKKYNDALGFNLKFNKENAATMVDLTQYLGMSDETAGKLVRRSELLGGTFKTNEKLMNRTTNEFNKQNRTAVPYSKILDKISNTSALAAFNIKGGTKGLTEAAAAAARYGREIDEIKNSAEQLLNFEDSISKELEAELLIGKDLNLEKLRYAALTGDVKTQEAEQSRLIRENFKNLKGNVLAQKAFAASIGMEADAVAKVVEQQELENKIRKEKGEKGLQQYQADLEAQAKLSQEAQVFDRQLQNAINSLKTALLPVIQAITPFFITMAEMAGKLANSLQGVGKFLGGGTGSMLMKLLGGGAAVGAIAYGGLKIANFAKKLKGSISGGIFTPKKGATSPNQPGTKKKTLLERIMGGKGTLGDAKDNPLYVYVVNQAQDMLDGATGKRGKGKRGGGRGGKNKTKGSSRPKGPSRRPKGPGSKSISSSATPRPSAPSSSPGTSRRPKGPGSKSISSSATPRPSAPSSSPGTSRRPKGPGSKSISSSATPRPSAPASKSFFGKIAAKGSNLVGKIAAKGSNLVSKIAAKGSNLVGKGSNFFGKIAAKGSNLVGKGSNFFGKIAAKGSNLLSKVKNPLPYAKNLLKNPFVKGVGKALGPILTAVTSIVDIGSLITEAKAQKAAGEEVNTGNLGKEIVKAAAYPIANLSLNLIPGVGTAISIADGILGAFGLSPIKLLTDSLIDFFPEEAFSGLGKLALGNNKKSSKSTDISKSPKSTDISKSPKSIDISKQTLSTDTKSSSIPPLTPMKDGAIVNTPTPSLVGEAGTEIITPVEKAPGIIAKTIEQSPILASSIKQSFSTPSFTTDNKKVEQIMSSILDVLNQINNKEGIINLDGSKVGTGLVMTNFKS